MVKKGRRMVMICILFAFERPSDVCLGTGKLLFGLWCWVDRTHDACRHDHAVYTTI